MAISVVVVGTLGRDPEPRRGPSGNLFVTLSVAHNESRRDAEGCWVDGETIWMRCVCWRTLAEHVLSSCHKGDRVVVTGRLTSREWTPKGEDSSRTLWEVQATEVAVSLRYALARTLRVASVPAPVASVAPPADGLAQSVLPASQAL